MAIKDVMGRVLGTVDKGAKGMENVIKGDVSGIVQSEAWIRFLWWSKLLMWVLILTVAGILIWHYWFRFNKKVLVKKLKGHAVIDTYIDRARIITDSRKKTKLDLLKTNKSCPVPSYKYTTKMGKLDFYELYLDEKGNLYPINDQQIIDQVTNEIVSDKNVDFHILSSWRLEEMKLAEEKFRKRTFFQEHMPEILIFMAMVFSTAMVWITMKSIETAGVQHAMAISELAKALASLK